jgi:hypothetical protein
MPRAPNTHVSFYADDIEDCKRAISELKMVILKLYGAAAARRLFADATPSRRGVKTDKNAFLLAEYLRRYKHYGRSVKRCAKDLAEANRRLPREWRYGPSGSTVPATMEKQLRRQIKRMGKDRGYREFIESHNFLPLKAMTMCEDPLFQNFMFRTFLEGVSPPAGTFQS